MPTIIIVTAEIEEIPNCAWKLESNVAFADNAMEDSAASTRARATGSAPPSPAGFSGEVTCTSTMTDPGYMRRIVTREESTSAAEETRAITTCLNAARVVAFEAS